MGRKSILVDIPYLQTVINEVQITQEWSGLTPFFNFVAEIYNKKYPILPINGGLINLRHHEGLITTTVQPGKKGRGKGGRLTPEHKEKMQAGRKGKGTILPFSAQKLKGLRERYNEGDEENEDTSMVALLNSFERKPTFKRLMKINCLACMGGSKNNDGAKEAIKNCSSPLCPFWENRGYK